MPPAGPALHAAPLPGARPCSPKPRAPVLAAAASLLLLAGLPALVQGTAASAARPKAPATATQAAKKGAAAKPANSRQKLDSAAKGLALASATTEAISADQLDIAARVLIGQADCEFKQTVQVLALPGRPGLFTIEHQGKRFVMAPRETSTGAVRLEDPAAGMVWLQIPAKSMLMNARIGQRLVDSCQHSEQRVAMLSVAAAAQTLGIEARAAVPQVPQVPAEVPAEAPAVAAASVAPAASAAPALPALPAASGARPVDADAPTPGPSAASPAVAPVCAAAGTKAGAAASAPAGAEAAAAPASAAASR